MNICTRVSYIGGMNSRTESFGFLIKVFYTAGHLVNMYINIYGIHIIVCAYKIYIYRPTTFASDCSPFLMVFQFPPLQLQILSACRMMS